MERAPRKQTHGYLHQAVKLGNSETVEGILKYGEDINGVDQDGKSPLHIAVERDTEDKELVTFLLGRGADATLQDRLGNTPLMSAIMYNPDCVSLIMMSTSGKDSVTIPNNWGWYPLHSAAIKNDNTIVKQLLENGAFIECKDSCGRTPLHWASVYDRNAVDQLLKHGAKVNCKDNSERTPLHWAGMYDRNAVDELLKHGAEVNCKDNCGRTPLHRAGMYDRNAVDKLLKHGAEVNCKDDCGRTPLHYANSSYCTSILLQMGAEVNSQDNDGQTPLHLFESHSIIPDSILQIGNTLLDWGASLTIKDNEGRIPSDICPAVVYCAKQYDVRRACVKLSDHPNDDLKLESYKTSCLEEAERLKEVRFGRNSLYDVFGQYSDPVFLFNEPLKEALSINDYRTRFPIYSSSLKSTFKRATKAYLLETAVDTLEKHKEMFFKTLERKIIWYILTFLDEENLQNVIKINLQK